MSGADSLANTRCPLSKSDRDQTSRPSLAACWGAGQNRYPGSIASRPPENHHLSILRQLNFDDILRRLVDPGMFPCRIKNVGLAPAGPYADPMGLVVVPFFNLPNSTQIELTELGHLGLGSSLIRKARIAAAGKAGERNEEEKQKAERPNAR